jgi:hypothetical protein
MLWFRLPSSIRPPSVTKPTRSGWLTPGQAARSAIPAVAIAAASGSKALASMLATWLQPPMASRAARPGSSA